MFLPAVSLPTNSTTLRARRVRIFLSVCLLNLCVFMLTPGSLAQEPSTDNEVLRVNTDLLLFPIRIRDKRGQNITSLTERDLTLKDEDRVTAGLYFSQGIDRVALVFALDQSGSTREIISLQRDAAVALFSRFNERSKIAVIRFAQRPALIAPFGRDAAVAREAFNFASAANQRTAIFDAAAAALNAFEDLPPVRSERRIVILISDGLDNASATKPSTIIEAASKKRVSFYVIHLPLFEPRDGRLAVRSPAKGFKELAEKTSGKYFLVGGPALSSNKNIDLKPTFQAIEDDLRNQYLLGFYLADLANDGRKHRFSLGLPSGFEYQVGQLGYSRTHEFFVNRMRQALKTPD
jgi:VWFA-related protein